MRLSTQLGRPKAVGIITGPIYAGYIYDNTQSYQAVFITFIVFYALAAVTLFLPGVLSHQ